MAQCFLATIGKCFEASGMEDIFIESGVFASGSIPRICNRKAYDRGVRAHKLLYECIYRLLWQAFSTYVKEKDMLDAPLLNIELAENSLKQCRQGFVDKDVESIVENQSNLLDCMPPLNGELQNLSKCHVKIQTFAFWWQYLEMMFILLRYVRAERNGPWELHLESAAEMIPFFLF